MLGIWMWPGPCSSSVFRPWHVFFMCSRLTWRCLPRPRVKVEDRRVDPPVRSPKDVSAPWRFRFRTHPTSTQAVCVFTLRSEDLPSGRFGGNSCQPPGLLSTSRYTFLFLWPLRFCFTCQDFCSVFSGLTGDVQQVNLLSFSYC